MKFIGSFARQIWQSDDGFTIAHFIVADNLGNAELGTTATVTGYNLPLNSFCRYEFEGHMKGNARYGPQFVCENYTESVGKTKNEILSFLNSGLFPGIGKATAKKIHKAFGDDCIDMIYDNPSILLQIKGITANKLGNIIASIEQHQVQKQMLMYARHYGIPQSATKKVIDAYGKSAYKIVSANPFVLYEEFNVGFKKVNQIAISEKKGLLNFPRLAAACMYTIGVYNSKGNMFIEYDVFMKMTLNLLNDGVDGEYYATEENLTTTLKKLISDKKVMLQKTKSSIKFYSSMNYEAESNTSKMIVSRILFEKDNDKSNNSELLLDEVENELKLKLNEKQREAGIKMIKNNIVIVTGGAGTGKTTALRGMAALYKKVYPNNQIAMCAPTGRAARRMSEVTGNDAQTIHSLLSIVPGAEDCEAIDSDIIFVDEITMVGTRLFYLLLKSIKSTTKVVLLGDHNQLPSVEPGNIIFDLLRCEHIPKVYLTEIYRQEENSSIKLNANSIINNPNASSRNLIYDDNFIFFNAHDETEAAGIICKNYIELIEKYGKDEVQILTPLREKGELSALHLNIAIQKLINHEKDGILVNGVLLSVGDKVINQKNNNQAKNGDIGTVRNIAVIDEAKSAVIDWQTGGSSIFSKDDLQENNVTLAYAITIHKSQGSEYECAMIPIMADSCKAMLKRNLLYTAITRAKSKVVIIGKKSSMDIAIRNNDIAKRTSLLYDRIMSLLLTKEKNVERSGNTVFDKRKGVIPGQISIADYSKEQPVAV